MKNTSKKRAPLAGQRISTQTVKPKSILELPLPKNFDPSILVGNGERIARICYFLHLLTVSPYDKRGFVPINMSRLRYAISRPAIKAALEQLASIIEIDSSYLKGEYSKGYRFCKAYRGQPSVKHSFHCPNLIARLRNIEKENADSATPIERQILDDMRKLSLPPDLNLNSIVEGIKPKAEVKDEMHRKNCIRHSAECIIKGEFGSVTTSEKSGRIHCLPNRTSSEIRPLYLLDGEAVVEIDLASSQPYFLASICQIPELTAAVSCGEFYSAINNNLFHPYDFDDKQKYREFKTAILSIIYAHGKYSYWEDENYKYAHLVKAMGNAYPKIHGFIRKYRKKHGGKALAIAMQSLESSVFIYEILAQLHREGIAVIPIHDSILCKASDAKYVEELLPEALIKKTGITPLLKRSDHISKEIAKDAEPKPSFGREFYLELLEMSSKEIMEAPPIEGIGDQLAMTG